MTLEEWRKAHPEAAHALRQVVDSELTHRPVDAKPGSEARAQQELRLLAARAGIQTYRNNSGAYKDDTGRLVRYGLGNDSARLCNVFKMGDLVGIKPVVITPEMLGQTIGQFWMREVKRSDWKYSGGEHELAQLNAINLVNRSGGDAAFSTGGL